MDFIERIFGVSPDGGSGMLEMVLAVAILLIFVLVMRHVTESEKLTRE